MTKIALGHPAFTRELGDSMALVESEFLLTPQVYLIRFYTGPLSTVNVLKHKAPWAPDEVIFQPWSMTTHVAGTTEARKLWNDTQIAYETDTADEPCTAMLVKVTAVDVNKTRTVKPTSTGGSTGGGGDALGTSTAGRGNDDGTVSSSDADQINNVRSNI